MSPEEQLACPETPIRAVDPRGPAGGGHASKNRSHRALESGTERADGRPRPNGEAAFASAERPASTDARWTTRVVKSETDFRDLADAWSALLSEAVDANVMMSHEWLYAWWSSYRPRAELAIVVAVCRDRIRGIAPLMIETVARAGISARVLRFIGDGTGETDHINVLVPSAEREVVMRVLLDGIEALRWDVARLNQIPQESPNTRDLVGWVERNGYHFSISSSPCPLRRLPATYEELLSALPSRLRTSLRSSRRKLEQTHAVEFGMHERQQELPDALQALFDNHESRWRGKGQAGAFANVCRRTFYTTLTPLLLERGWLRFFYLKLDGRTVAQQYCFALDGTVMLLQEGFDFSRAQDNVGNVLRSFVFEHLIRSGADSYDFLAGSSRHKQSWSDSSANDLCVHFSRPSWRGRIFFGLPNAVERLKDRLRPWKDRALGRHPDAHGR